MKVSDTPRARGRARRTGLCPALTLSVALVVFGACTPAMGATRGHQNAQASPESPVTVTFETDYLPNGKYVPFLYGKSQGYYKQQGIDLQIKYGRGSALTADAVAQNKVDIGMVGSGTLALAISKGEPIVSVGLYLAKNDYAYYVPIESSIKSISELKGKRLIVSPGTPQALVTPAILRLAGLNEDDVTKVTVSAAIADSTYAHGRADAIGETVNFAPIFQKIRKSRELPWVDVGFKMPGFSFAVTKKMLSAHPDLVARFLSATYRSIAGALDNPSQAIAAYAKSQPTLKKSLIAPEWKLLRHFFCSDAQIASGAKLGYQIPSDWSDGIEILQKTKMLPPDISAKSLYTNVFFSDHHVSQRACTADWGGKAFGGASHE